MTYTEEHLKIAAAFGASTAFTMAACGTLTEDAMIRASARLDAKSRAAFITMPKEEGMEFATMLNKLSDDINPFRA